MYIADNANGASYFGGTANKHTICSSVITGVTKSTSTAISLGHIAWRRTFHTDMEENLWVAAVNQACIVQPFFLRLNSGWGQHKVEHNISERVFFSGIPLQNRWIRRRLFADLGQCCWWNRADVLCKVRVKKLYLYYDILRDTINFWALWEFTFPINWNGSWFGCSSLIHWRGIVSKSLAPPVHLRCRTSNDMFGLCLYKMV